VAQFSLGIDIGGTFTDLVAYDHDTGQRWSRKVLTTHEDPARAVASGVAALLGEGRLAPAHFTRVVHATTLFTNALIERKGARTGLITTAGFADTLEIGRERKVMLMLGAMRAEQRLATFLLDLAERYAGWDADLGRAILTGQRSFDDLERYVLSHTIEPRPRSGRQEMLENLVSRSD